MSTAAKTEAEPAPVEVPELVDHTSLAEALAAFQAALPSIRKSNTATVKPKDSAQFTYGYADLSDVSEVALPLLASHGLSWSTRPTVTAHGFVLKYSLTHVSGEALRGAYPLPAVNTPPQQLGAAITYARRYALCAVTGIAPGGDDNDATTAPVSTSTRGKQAPREPIQADVMLASKDWVAMAKDTKTVEDLRALYHQVEVAGELAAKIHADDNMTVGQALWARRQHVPAATAKRAPVAPREDAPASESDSEQPLSEAEQAELDAREASAESAAPAAAPRVLAEPELDWNVAPIPGAEP